MEDSHSKLLVKKLDNRFESLRTYNLDIFFLKLSRFYLFIKNNETLNGILNDFKKKNKRQDLNTGVFRGKDYHIKEIKSEESLVLLAHNIILILLDTNKNRTRTYYPQKEEFDSFTKHLCDLEQVTYKEQIDCFIDFYVKAIYDFLIETLYETKSLLRLTDKFRRKVEWFNKAYFLRLFNDNTSKGEDVLSMAYYEYLFENGITFHLEPRTESGRVDLVISKKNRTKIIADAKIFDGGARGKNYILKGLNQLLTYVKEENQGFGFLLIFETTAKRLFFNSKLKEEGFPYMIIDNKQIFFITVNIYSDDKSASRRGKINMVEIGEEEIRNMKL